MAYISVWEYTLPSQYIRNEDLIQFPEKYRDVIHEKAGIKGRYHADIAQSASDLGAIAVSKMLGKSNIERNSIEGIVCATSSPDSIQPATAARIQALCGLQEAFAFDVNSVCAGGIYALQVAAALVDSGYNNIIVVAAEVYSKILDPSDIMTYPYFGDGAAAILVSKDGLYKLSHFKLGTDGTQADTIRVPAGGSKLPYGNITKKKDVFFQMNGAKVYNFACEKATELILDYTFASNTIPDKIITHQANANIIKEIAKRTRLAESKYFSNVERLGNTAAASVFIAFCEAVQAEAELKEILLVAFGGGLSWGRVLLTKG